MPIAHITVQVTVGFYEFTNPSYGTALKDLYHEINFQFESDRKTGKATVTEFDENPEPEF